MPYSAGAVIGIDIGGTKISIGIADMNSSMLSRYERSTPQDPNEGVEWILAKIADWHKKQDNRFQRIYGIGIGCAGPLDKEAGMVLHSPNLPKWIDYPISEALREEYDVPVFLENDANLAALGEHRLGAGRGMENIVYITVSTGIGGGIIANGKLVTGVGGSAGEIGHMTIKEDGPDCNCGSKGCLETLASGTAIVRMAAEWIKNSDKPSMMRKLVGIQGMLTAELVAKAASNGDEAAEEIIHKAMGYLGIGVANVVTTLSPEAVVIGGGVAKIGETLFKKVNEVVRERVRLVPVEKVKIIPASLAPDSGLYGAFHMVTKNKNNIAQSKE